MSSKKINLILEDKFFMELSFQSWQVKIIGLTGENPSVGCVIVKNNQIISFGANRF